MVFLNICALEGEDPMIGATRVAEGGPGYFVRNATGLVRELSWFDTFVAGFALLNVMLGMTQSFAFIPYVFPGANVALAFLLGAPVALAMGYVYGAFSAAMPRSGGDYVWVSRTISPVVGFAVNCFFTLELLAFMGINLWFTSSWFLPDILYIFGLKDAGAWAATPTAALILGAVLVVGLTAVFLRGINLVKKLTMALFIVNSIGLLVWMAVMVFGSQSGFSANLDGALGAGTYQGVIDSAKSGGYVLNPTDAGRNQLFAVILAMQSYFGFQMIGYFAGEIKRVSKAAFQAVGVSFVAGAVLFVAVSVLVVQYYGSDFIGSAAYLFNASPGTYPIPAGGFLSGLSMYVSDNIIVQLVIAVGFLSTTIWILPPMMLMVTRNFFAWSFDRILPSWMADVNEGTHSPTKATIAAGILTYVFLLLTLYTTFWAYLVNLSGIASGVLIIVGIAAIVFPYRRKDIFDKAPWLVTVVVLRLPLIVWGGIFLTVFEVVIFAFAFTTPAIGGAISFASLAAGASLFVVAFPIYAIAWYVRRRRGFDLSLSSQQLPPE
jgi:basic amino acid/polyamine antiporter, APA family